MLTRLFPKQFDNAYRGQPLAIWLFAVVTLMELAIGTNSLINTRMVAMSADGIPLERYGEGGAEAVIALFALAGLFRVLLALQCVVAMVRYRTMIPFLFLVLLLVHVGSKVLLWLHPVAKSGVATAQLGSALILAIVAMLAVGLVLSLVPRKQASA